jgi:hypothetical protein
MNLIAAVARLPRAGPVAGRRGEVRGLTPQISCSQAVSGSRQQPETKARIMPPRQTNPRTSIYWFNRQRKAPTVSTPKAWLSVNPAHAS